MSIRVSIASGLAVGACGGKEGPGPEQRQAVVELAATPIRDLDLLFVVDDSVGMDEAQRNLAAGFPGFLERLQGIPGGLPSLHLGVISTDMGTKASSSPTPAPEIGQVGMGGCRGAGKGGVLQTNAATTVGGRFVIDVDAAGGGRMTNYTGSLAEVFGRMTKAGAGGCGFEQPLAAMRAALDGHPMNAGFLRPEAMLGVVFLGDEDDCSVASTAMFMSSPALGPLDSFRCTQFGVTCEGGGRTPDEMKQVGEKSGCGANEGSDLVDGVVAYRDFLHGLKPDARRIVVGAIVGPSAPVAVELRSPPGGGMPVPGLKHVCLEDRVIADPAVRLQAFADGFRDRSAFTPICSQDLSGSLGSIANVFRRAMGSPCVDVGLADMEPEVEGAQVDCVVSDLVDGVPGGRIEACEENPEARPCWELERDAAGCGSSPAPHLKLVVRREGAPEPGTITQMDCLVER